MAKWDFKIVGASFVKELVPIADDVQPRSQSFMQPSFHLEGGKIVIKESGQYVTAIYFSQIGEIDGVAPTDIDDAYAKLLTLVENFNGGGGTPPNLGEVLTQGNRAPLAVNANRVFTLEDRTKNLYSLFDLSTTVSLTLNNSVAYDLGDVLKIQHYVGVDGSEASTMNLVFDFVVVFYGNDLITSFSIPYGAVAYLEKILPSVWTLSYKLAQDIGGSVTPSTLISTDADNALTVGTDSKLFVAESTGTLPYQELIFTAVQTAPQTGITSGTLIEGGRYTITNADITADFTISGAPNNDVGTVFIANATPPDWGVLGELSFSGNPIVTILNNPLSDTYTSGYNDIGSYYLEGLLDFPVDTFPKLGADDYVDNVIRSQSDGSALLSKSYLWHKDNFNDKRILIKTMTGGGYDLEDDQLNGTQLFIVKIFNP